jgi:hypothetical protein
VPGTAFFDHPPEAVLAPPTAPGIHPPIPPIATAILATATATAVMAPLAATSSTPPRMSAIIEV